MRKKSVKPEVVIPDPKEGIKRKRGRPKGSGKRKDTKAAKPKKDRPIKATAKEIKEYLISFWNEEKAKEWVEDNYNLYLLKILVPLIQKETDITALGMPQIVYLSHPPMRDYDTLVRTEKSAVIDNIAVYQGTQRLEVDEAGRA